MPAYDTPEPVARAHANLENLKKQAKLCVRRHREGRTTVAAMIRGVLRAFSAMTDRQILDGPFKLADAQLLVARRSGFETWSALKQGHDPLNAKSAIYPSQPIPLNIEPSLFVSDIGQSLAFFTEKLGFKIGLTYGEPAFFAQVVRDGAPLNLRQVKGPVMDRTEGADLLSASISVSNARQLFQEFQDRDVPFHQTLRREPWHGQGQGNFIVADPDGNLLMFGGRTD